MIFGNFKKQPKFECWICFGVCNIFALLIWPVIIDSTAGNRAMSNCWWCTQHSWKMFTKCYVFSVCRRNFGYSRIDCFVFLWRCVHFQCNFKYNFHLRLNDVLVLCRRCNFFVAVFVRVTNAFKGQWIYKCKIRNAND